MTTFTENRRHRRYPHVELLIATADVELSILRHSLLRDVWVTHNLYSRDNRIMSLSGIAQYLSQNPVDPHPRYGHLFIRFEMDVTGVASYTVIEK